MAYNDGKLNAIVLNPRGQLDTANPPTDREPGTLVAAEDVHPAYLGPREGALSGDNFTTGAILNTPYVFNGTDVYGVGFVGKTENYDIPMNWTYDWWGKPDLGTPSTERPLFYIFGPTGTFYVAIGNGAVNLNFRGTSSRGVAEGAGNLSTANAVTLTSLAKVHVRIVKSLTTVTIYYDGVAVYTVTNARYGYPIEEPLGLASSTSKTLYIGNDAATKFYKGVMYGTLLRSGAYSDTPFSQAMPNHIGANFIHYYIGRGTNTKTYMNDYGSYAAHAKMIGTVTTTSSVIDAPCTTPIQGMGTFTTRDNKTIGLAVSAGFIVGRYDP